MSFDVRTAYANEWRHFDQIDDGVMYELTPDGVNTGRSWQVKCFRQSVAESYLANLAAEQGINPADTLITVWLLAASDPKPTSPAGLQIGGTKWIVQRVIERRHGPVFDCLVGNPLTGNRFGQF